MAEDQQQRLPADGFAVPSIRASQVSSDRCCRTIGDPAAAVDGPSPSTMALGEHLAWVILELAPDAVLVVDRAGRILLANHAAENIFGYDRNAMVSLSVEALVPTRHQHDHRQHRIGYDDAPQTRPMGLALDLWARRADGSEFAVDISLGPVTLASGNVTIAIVRDMTAQRAIELALRERLVAADEDRIGAELHHRIIEHLFAAGMKIQSVAAHFDEHVADRLQAAVADLDTAIREIRNTVFDNS